MSKASLRFRTTANSRPCANPYPWAALTQSLLRSSATRTALWSGHQPGLAGRCPRKLALPRHTRELLLLASHLILTLAVLGRRQETDNFEHLLDAAARRQIKPNKIAHTEMIAHPVPPGLMASARNVHP